MTIISKRTHLTFINYTSVKLKISVHNMYIALTILPII